MYQSLKCTIEQENKGLCYESFPRIPFSYLHLEELRQYGVGSEETRRIKERHPLSSLCAGGNFGLVGAFKEMSGVTWTLGVIQIGNKKISIKVLWQFSWLLFK